MPEYKLVISKTAQKQLDKLPDNIADPLIKSWPLIQGLEDALNFRHADVHF
jgi:mRNA-degrading endonuclease RelE of RelBE toxin-antitoxin system